MDNNVVIAFDPAHTITVKKTRFYIILFGVFMLALLAAFLIIWGCLYYNSLNNDPKFTFDTRKVDPGYQYIPFPDKNSCESNCSKMIWDEDKCRCKNGFYGQNCQAEYGGKLKYVGTTNLTAGKLLKSTFADSRVTGCDQLCRDNVSCTHYYWQEGLNCGSTGVCQLYSGDLLANSNDISQSLDNGYYVRDNETLQFTDKIFLSKFYTFFNGKFWKNMGLFGSTLSTYEYKKISFCPVYQKIPRNCIGIYSTVPFNYLDYKSIIESGNNDYIRVSKTPPDFPSSWLNLDEFYVYFVIDN